MVYVKNLPRWERVARVAAAALLGSCAFHYGLTIVGASFGLVAAVGAVTAAFGFCPGCALAGRRIDAAGDRA